MNYSFRAEALAEYEEAIRYYFAIDPALSRDFVAEIEQAVARVCQSPRLRPVVGSYQVRRHLVSRFPFGVYYVCEDDKVTIWAIVHQSRNPRRWQARKP